MIASFLVGVKISFQYVRKEENPKNGKHDKQLDQDDPPQLSAPGHVPETLIIKPEYLFQHWAAKSTIKLRILKITLPKYIYLYYF